MTANVVAFYSNVFDLSEFRLLQIPCSLCRIITLRGFFYHYFLIILVVQISVSPADCPFGKEIV